MVITVDYTGTGTWTSSRPQLVDVFHSCHFRWAPLKRFQRVDAAPVTKGACFTRTVWQLASASLFLVIVIWHACQPCHAGTEGRGLTSWIGLWAGVRATCCGAGEKLGLPPLAGTVLLTPSRHWATITLKWRRSWMSKARPIVLRVQFYDRISVG